MSDEHAAYGRHLDARDGDDIRYRAELLAKVDALLGDVAGLRADMVEIVAKLAGCVTDTRQLPPDAPPIPTPPILDPTPEPAPEPPPVVVVEPEPPEPDESTLQADYSNPWGVTIIDWEKDNLTRTFDEINAGHGRYGAIEGDSPLLEHTTAGDNGPHRDLNFRFFAAPSHYMNGCPARPDGPLMLYVGNRLAHPDIDADELAAMGTSSVQGGLLANRTTYVTPAVLNPDGDVQMPESVLFYYKDASHQPLSSIPQGLRLVAGNAVPAPGNGRHSYRQTAGWGVPNRSGLLDSKSRGIPAETNNGLIRSVVGFPQLIKLDANGVPLDGPGWAHESQTMEHVGNNGQWVMSSSQAPTPAGWDRIARIEMIVDYRVDGSTEGWRLSTDQPDQNGGESLYAVAMFAWNPAAGAAWLDGCRNRNCSEGHLGVLPGVSPRRLAKLSGPDLVNQRFKGDPVLRIN